MRRVEPVMARLYATDLPGVCANCRTAESSHAFVHEPESARIEAPMRRALAVLFATTLSLVAQDTPPATPRRAVLVTGASSGIGRKTTEVLAANGFFVWAGARKDADLQDLAKLANVQPIRLDVTKQADIDAAAKIVRDSGRGLFGLVNNAGIAVLGPMIELRDEDLVAQLEVNVLGPFRVTKAFAPLLVESKGRIVTTGSISGFVTWDLGGAYTMSKHAVEAFTDTLADELRPFGVTASVVEPGNYRSEIMKGMHQRLIDGGYGGEGSLYRKPIERLKAQSSDRSKYAEPDAVADAFLRALNDATPQRRYMVVPDRREAELTLRATFARVAQLNAEHPFSFDRDTLVEMLDAALRAK